MKEYFIDELFKRTGYTPSDVGIKNSEIELQFIDKYEVDNYIDSLLVERDLSKIHHEDLEECYKIPLPYYKEQNIGKNDSNLNISGNVYNGEELIGTNYPIMTSNGDIEYVFIEKKE